MGCRDAGVEADARERADLALGVAKNPIARVSILARVSGPSRGRFRHGHNLYLLAMTVAVVSEVQVPKNGCFIAAEAVPGVTPGWSHTDPYSNFSHRCGSNPFFIENLSFHRARKFYSWMLSFLGKLTHGLQIDQKWLKCRI